MTRDPLRVRRLPEKQIRSRAALDAVLDEALVAHVAVPSAQRLAVVPVGVARDGDRLLIHGSAASQAFRTLAGGVPTCLTVTLLDGVVVARSQFESSMQYRCAMVFGSFAAVPEAEKRSALAVLSARLLPGLDDPDGPRAPSAKELAATLILAMPLDSWSLKVSDSEPEDAAEDLDRPVWAGVVALRRSWGPPVTATDLRFPLEPPAALKVWPVRG